MVVNYNDNGELTMGGTSLKTIAQSFGTPSIVYDEDQIRNQIRRYHKAFEASGLSYNILCLKSFHMYSDGQIN